MDDVPVDAEGERYLQEWLRISTVLTWVIILASVITLPLLSFTLVYLRIHRRSQYYPFLTAIVIGNFVQLSIIAFTLFSELLESSGQISCKVTHYVANVSACCVHWTWVGMYIQRCCFIFRPMQSIDANRLPWSVLCSTRNLIIIIALISALSQLWTPILMTQNDFTSNNRTGTYCGTDDQLGNSSLYQTIAIMESIVTFVIPFCLTVLTDISVFFCRHPCHKKFTLVSSESLKSRPFTSSKDSNSSGRKLLREDSAYLKIVSEKKIQSSVTRRHQAIRRCLLMATFTLSLNIPNFMLQLIDEFLNLRFGLSVDEQIFYLKADAVAYVLYLIQFPMVPVFVNLSKHDLEAPSSCRRRKSGSVANALSLVVSTFDKNNRSDRTYRMSQSIS